MRYLLILLLFASWKPIENPTLKKGAIYDYIDKNAIRAINTMHETGVPASLILAMALEESAAGTSEVAQKANNHFGLKTGFSWKGSTYCTPRGSCFREYATIDESYKDFADLLSNPKYKFSNMLVYGKKDYKRWAKGIQEYGYCTSKTYSNRIIKIIEEHELHNLDNCILEFK